MVKFPWFSMYAEAWLTSASVVRMNCTQEGAYIRLLCYTWLDKHCSLPRDTDQLKQLARWRGTEKGFEPVEQCFIIHPDDHTRYTNARLYEEWKKAKHISDAHRAAAIKRHHPEQFQASKPSPRLADRSGSGFESVGQIADKHFKPR